MRRLIYSIIALFIMASASAVPARRGIITLIQPDGSRFEAVIKGDEFTRIRTTRGGAHIIQASDGFYCYAGYDSKGRRFSTGIRVTEAGIMNPVPTDAYTGNLAPLSPRSIEMRSSARYMQRLQATTTKADQNNEKNGIIILAEFSDIRFQNDREAFDALINQEGYSKNGAKGCALEYFNDQFKGKYEFNFDISEIVTLSKNREYYGSNDPATDFDHRVEDMITEACILADSEIDFSKYDNNKDGIVENVFVFFAGRSEAEGGGEDCIWPHAYSLSETGSQITLDGVQINGYACASELNLNEDKSSFRMASIGTFCHEFSHTLGLYDLYDTNYEGTEGVMAAGCWESTSIMDGGNYNCGGACPPNYNALERLMVGINEKELLAEGEYEIKPVQEETKTYILDTDKEDEFYVLECRNNEGWDLHIGGSGMLVYHVDMSDNDTGISEIYEIPMTARQRWTYNEVNANASHQCCDLIEADGRSDRISEANSGSLNDIKGIFYPSQKNNSITAHTVPAIKYWSGKVPVHAVTGISMNGENVRFNIKKGSKIEPPEVEIFKTEIFQDAAIIVWKADQKDFTGDAEVLYGPSNAEKDTCTVKMDNGNYTLIMRGLEPRTAHRVEISFSVDGLKGAVKSHGFTTKSFDENEFPYIYVKGCIRNSDGSFNAETGLPLVMYNAVNAETVKWYFDGKDISDQVDSYFRPGKSGELKAVAEYKDGSREVIIKHIEVK